MNYTITDNVFQDFINQITEELLREDIPRNKVIFMIAPLHQMIIRNPEKLSELRKMLLDYPVHNMTYNKDTTGGYTNGSMQIYCVKYDEESELPFDVKSCLFSYEIEFLWEENYLGMCECEEGDPGYRHDKHCCGHKCDWVVPQIAIRKIFDVDNYEFSWEERDLWDYEDYMNNMFAKKDADKYKLEIESKIEHENELIHQAQERLFSLQTKLQEINKIK